MKNKLWKTGGKKWEYFFVGLFLLVVSTNQLYKGLNIYDGFFFVLSLLLMISSGVSIRKATKYEDQVNFAIIKRNFLHKVDGVVNLVPASDLVGFFIDKKYYPVDCEDGSYVVDRYPYDEKVTFYTYRFVNSALDMLVVKDIRQDVNGGGIVVYKR